jgi:hypothetical protein
VECTLGRVNFRRVSDSRRVVRPAFGVNETSDAWYRSPIGVIVISLGTPQSAGENFGYTREQLGAPATSLGVLATSLEAPATRLGEPATSLEAPTTSLGAPRITVDQTGKNIFVNAAGVLRNHSYYLLFNNC